MSAGTIFGVGLGPGDPRYLTPAASAALDAAQDLIGYIPYVARVPERPGLGFTLSERMRALTVESAEFGTP